MDDRKVHGSVSAFLTRTASFWTCGSRPESAPTHRGGFGSTPMATGTTVTPRKRKSRVVPQVPPSNTSSRRWPGTTRRRQRSIAKRVRLKARSPRPIAPVWTHSPEIPAAAAAGQTSPGVSVGQRSGPRVVVVCRRAML
jgi:hypothetical protein